MIFFKNKILKIRLNKIFKKKLIYKEYLKEIYKEFNKEEISKILNNKENCKIFLTKLLKKIYMKDREETWGNLNTLNFVEGYIEIVFLFKEKYKIEITPYTFLYFISLPELLELRINLKEKIEKIEKYFEMLPAFNPNAKNQSLVCYEHHGFLVMGFTEIVSLIGEQYKFKREKINLVQLELSSQLINF